MGQWYWVLLEQAASLVEAAMMYVFISRFFEQRYRWKWIPPVTIAILFGIISIMNVARLPGVLTLCLFLAAGILASLLLFRSSVFAMVLIPLLLTALILISEALAVGITQLVFNVSTADFVSETPYRMLGIVISKPVLIVLVYGVSMFSKKDQTRIPLGYSLCIMTVPVISAICMITIIQFVGSSVESILSPVWLAISAIGLIFMSFLAIYLFQALMEYSRAQSKYMLMAQQVEMLNSHLHERNALQEETHRIWHDMKNHFTVIQWMVSMKSYEKLDQYMLTLNETVSNSMLKVQTGNPILDALFNSKVADAKKSGIDMAVNVAIPSRISVEDIDLNIVFSNALDNALDACKKLPAGKERFVAIDSHLKNDHLVLIMRNSFDGVVNKSGDILQTTKTERGLHGIGMGNMRRVVEKYDGHIITDMDNGVFTLTLAMYCLADIEKAG